MLSHPFVVAVGIAVAIPVAALTRKLYGRSRIGWIAVTAAVISVLAAAVVVAIVVR